MPDPPSVPKKICLLGTSLADGGANKNQAVLSKLFEAKGIAVTHVIVNDAVGFDYAGTLFNMGKLKSRGMFDRVRRFLALRKFLRRGKFDFIIDFRNGSGFFQEWLLVGFVFGRHYIRTVRSFSTDYYFPSDPKLASLLYGRIFAIVAVSGKIAEKVRKQYGYRNVTTILNPLDFAEMERKKTEFRVEGDYIVTAGRMDDPEEIKQFGPLLRAYAGSTLPMAGIGLALLGDGANRPKYEALAKELGISGLVRFEGFRANPYPWYANALFYVLSSRNEGFPTALNEAVACGTPAVSFDCESGPSDIIRHGENGLLVANQDFQALTSAMDTLAYDRALRQKLKENCAATNRRHDFDVIFDEWLALFNSKP